MKRRPHGIALNLKTLTTKVPGITLDTKWAETNNPGTCGGRSQSFIEGCEEYQQQESEYEDCEAKSKK
jgi:hypothetical protein